MKRATSPYHLFAAAATTDANIAITFSNMPVIYAYTFSCEHKTCSLDSLIRIFGSFFFCSTVDEEEDPPAVHIPAGETSSLPETRTSGQSETSIPEESGEARPEAPGT